MSCLQSSIFITLKIYIMIKAYLENGKNAELIATFETESMYNQCVPALEKLAIEKGLTLTESVEENETLQNKKVDYLKTYFDVVEYLVEKSIFNTNISCHLSKQNSRQSFYELAKITTDKFIEKYKSTIWESKEVYHTAIKEIMA